jgi:hypothetical protein
VDELAYRQRKRRRIESCRELAERCGDRAQEAEERTASSTGMSARAHLQAAERQRQSQELHAAAARLQMENLEQEEAAGERAESRTQGR